MNKRDEFKRVLDEAEALYVRKNNDYGDSFSKSYQKFGDMGVVIRLWDKLNRYETLIENEQSVVDESIEDSLIDLLNYAAMTIVERRLKNKEK